MSSTTPTISLMEPATGRCRRSACRSDPRRRSTGCASAWLIDDHARLRRVLGVGERPPAQQLRLQRPRSSRRSTSRWFTSLCSPSYGRPTNPDPRRVAVEADRQQARDADRLHAGQARDAAHDLRAPAPRPALALVAARRAGHVQRGQALRAGTRGSRAAGGRGSGRAARRRPAGPPRWPAPPPRDSSRSGATCARGRAAVGGRPVPDPRRRQRREGASVKSSGASSDDRAAKPQDAAVQAEALQEGHDGHHVGRERAA